MGCLYFSGCLNKIRTTGFYVFLEALVIPSFGRTTPTSLSPCPARCVFIGYSLNSKGYQCLDVKFGKVFTSRYVQFYETEFPFTTTLDSSVTSPHVLSITGLDPTSSLHEFSGHDSSHLVSILNH